MSLEELRKKKKAPEDQKMKFMTIDKVNKLYR